MKQARTELVLGVVWAVVVTTTFLVVALFGA